MATLQTVLGQNGNGQNGLDKMVWAKCYADKMVLAKTGSGQHGTDKMALTKCYGDKMLADKSVQTKRSGQKG